MNRRIFLKLTGITTIFAPALLVLNKKTEPQWVNMRNKLPEMNQRVIILEGKHPKDIKTSGKNYNIIREGYKSYESKTRTDFKIDFVYHIKKLNKCIVEDIFKNNNHFNSKISYFIDKNYVSYIHENIWWIPSNKELTEFLPSIPKPRIR